MIYFSEKPIPMSHRSNIVMLDLQDDLGHVYVSKPTYDQALLIYDKYNGDVTYLDSKLNIAKNQDYVVDYMRDVLPIPLDILTPFYNLINNVEINIDNLSETIGLLSYISSIIDFNAYIKVPYEVRAKIVFSKSVLNDYKQHLEEFYSQNMNTPMAYILGNNNSMSNNLIQATPNITNQNSSLGVGVPNATQSIYTSNVSNVSSDKPIDDDDLIEEEDYSEDLLKALDEIDKEFSVQPKETVSTENTNKNENKSSVTKTPLNYTEDQTEAYNDIISKYGG